MRVSKAIFLTIALVVASSLFVARPFAAAADYSPTQSTIIGQSEVSESFVWPEAGLEFLYPAGWEVMGDQNFDFVIVGPEDISPDGFVFIGMQSGSLASNESLEEVMASIAGTAELQETDLDGVVAWRFDEVSDQHTAVIGFESASHRVSILLFSAPLSVWDAWEANFDEVIASISINPLELDTELLNAQLQASVAADGTLTLGDPDAPALLVEFMDFSCPHCADFRHSIDRLVQDYVLSGKARLNLNVLTFVGGEFSDVAAKAEYCAAQLGFGWDMHELLFVELTDKGAQAAFTNDNISALVAAQEELEIDLEAFDTCLVDASGTIANILENNSAQANELAVQGTPTLFIGTSQDSLVMQQSRALVVIYDYIDNLSLATTTEESTPSTEG